MKKIEGPWYTLNDAQEKLGINRSELSYLVSEGSIQAVVYTRKRRFLLFRRNDSGWIGHASCNYRGHLTLHQNCIRTLMDEEELTLSTGSGTLCEAQGVSNWAPGYPFKKPLPHEPLINWIPTEQETTDTSRYSATPFPEEGEPAVIHLARTALDISKKSKADQNLITPLENMVYKKSHLKLWFKTNSLFTPENLRIPASELTRYQQASTVKAVIDPGVNQTSNKRENELHTLIKRIVKENPNISANDAWRLIQHDYDTDEPLFDIDGILLRVDGLCIEWESRHGNTESIARKSFGPLLSKIKKKLTQSA